MNKKLVGLSSLTGIAGLVIGVGIGSGTSHTTIKTVAGPEKIVTKDVPVPGPTVTKDVPVPGPTKTVIKTVIKDIPAPAPSSASQPSPASGDAGETVEFIAYGTCNPQITYGPSGSDNNGYVGMDVKMAILASAPSYYAIQAQCQQGGSASVILKVDGTQISSGVANGAYNIASAEISQDPISGPVARRQHWLDNLGGGVRASAMPAAPGRELADKLSACEHLTA